MPFTPFHPWRYMVLAAWLITLISVTPQAVIFRVLKHPQSDFYQCTTEGFFESLSTEKVLVNNVTTYYLPGGLTPKQAGDLYHTIFNCQVLTYTIQGPWRAELKLLDPSIHSSVKSFPFINYLLQVFLFPLIVIMVSYSKIFLVIFR